MTAIIDLSPQRILGALPQQHARGVTIDWLASNLSVKDEQKRQLRQFLDEFVRLRMATVRDGRYRRLHRADLLIGKMRFTRSGAAFVVPESEAERRRGDLLISKSNRAGALQGDIVVAQVIKTGQAGREGRVEQVLRRTSLAVVGMFSASSKGGSVAPLDDSFYYEISVAVGSELGASGGDVVNVEITRPPVLGHPPSGRVIEVLGPFGTPGLDLEIVIRKHRLPTVFPDAVLRESDAIPDSVLEEQVAGRADYRGWPTVTIDGETARDFDDAVSIERTGDGYRLGVHIADVSYYVRAGSALDEEALRRATSVYFPEKAIPMLPERLSNGICSLNPGVDRLAMSAVMDVDRTGRVHAYTLTPSVIHSLRRMTYTDVNRILAEPDGETARAHSRVTGMLLDLSELAAILTKRREEQGAIDFDLPEAELLFDDEGQVCGITRSERNMAHRLIEEFMLMANETVATHLESLRVPSIYRIHEEPKPAKLEEFAKLVESFGRRFSFQGPVPQRGFQHLLREIEGAKEERTLSRSMLRSMERARYSERNTGHFGLAMQTYTHFTSPIRRYPDLMVHRILREVLDHGRASPVAGSSHPVDLGRSDAIQAVSWQILDDALGTDLRSGLDRVAEHSSERERAADDAERELMDWRKSEFMAGQIGNEFEGIITGVRDYGFWVELDEHMVEGLVHNSTLTSDAYVYEERKHLLRGEKSDRRYQVGNRVRVAVDRVDRGRHTIYFSVI